MVIISTSKGDIHIKLHEETAPKTVANFREYIANEFYKDTVFHRVINNFMIQGGGLSADMQQKETLAPVVNEAETAQANKRGTIAMARTMDPDSATAQFFINLVNNNFLDFSEKSKQGYGYCVFGEVTKGMEVVDEIAKVNTGNKMGHSDVPVEPITILAVTEQADE